MTRLNHRLSLRKHPRRWGKGQVGQDGIDRRAHLGHDRTAAVVANGDTTSRRQALVKGITVTCRVLPDRAEHARAEAGTLGPEPLWTGLGRQLGARLLQSKEATTCSSAEKDWNVVCMRSGQHGHVSCGEATTKRRPPERPPELARREAERQDQMIVHQLQRRRGCPRQQTHR